VFENSAVKDYEMSAACSMHGRNDKFIQQFGDEPEGTRPLGRPKHI
jgi:hypothetical protein